LKYCTDQRDFQQVSLVFILSQKAMKHIVAMRKDFPSVPSLFSSGKACSAEATHPGYLPQKPFLHPLAARQGRWLDGRIALFVFRPPQAVIENCAKGDEKKYQAPYDLTSAI
jgi:hypothetical protein